MHSKQKLYVVICRNLSAGAQAVQAGHALVSFGLEYNEIYKAWNKTSNHLCYLSVEDEQALEFLLEEAKSQGIRFSVFREIDLQNRLTAAAFEPTSKVSGFLSRLPLALKEYR